MNDTSPENSWKNPKDFWAKTKAFFSKTVCLPKTEALENAEHAFTPAERVLFYILTVIFAGAAVIMLFTVSNDYTVQIPKQGGTLTEGIIGTPNFVNPLFATTDAENDISSLIYSGLMKRDSDGKLVPDLAQSYTISPDGRTYTFTLRSDATFQDGTPVTADDVAFTIQKATDPDLKSPRLANWEGVQVKEISPEQIQFTLTQPYAPFLDNTTLGILPKDIWQNINNDQFSQFSNLIGSGPYELQGIARDSSDVPTSYTLTAFDGYVAGAPYIKTLVFKFYSDENDALTAWKSGEIDSVSSVSPEDIASFVTDAEPTLTANTHPIADLVSTSSTAVASANTAMVKTNSSSDSVIEKAPLPRLFGVFFNQSQAPVFTNKEVREALSMVVNRQAIIDQVLGGYGVPISEPVPAGTLTADATTSSETVSPALSAVSGNPSVNIFGTSTTIITPQQQIINAAKALLTKNGWGYNPADGLLEKTSGKTIYQLKFSIYTSNTPELLETAAILQQEWTALGAQVDIKSFELGDLNETVLRPRKYDVLLFGEVVSDPSDLYAFWDSSQRNDPGLNIAMYTNSKADKIVEQLRTTLDPAQQEELIEQFENQFDADIPAIFLYSPDLIYILPKSVQDFQMQSVVDPSDRFDNINQWYIETENVWKIFINK